MDWSPSFVGQVVTGLCARRSSDCGLEWEGGYSLREHFSQSSSAEAMLAAAATTKTVRTKEESFMVSEAERARASTWR